MLPILVILFSLFPPYLTQPVDHESMESLKIIDNKPIDLYDCFKAFVREDELGDEESWLVPVSQLG